MPSEPYRHGERLKAFIVEVRKTAKGPQIIVSRTHPGLLRKLFELEVPEIAEGIVEIKAVAREPGHRSKIAVTSHEPGVDPVGACVGAKGSRVRMVVNELRGEKIDVVQWTDDLAKFVANALAPAKVKEVRVDADDRHRRRSSSPTTSSRWRSGRRARTPGSPRKLTGCRIDIKSETQAVRGRATRPCADGQGPRARRRGGRLLPQPEPRARSRGAGRRDRRGQGRPRAEGPRPPNRPRSSSRPRTGLRRPPMTERSPIGRG